MAMLTDSLTLPCGAILKNRLAKAAMSENMATSFGPGVAFQNSYKKWAQGGTGLLISGNVMVDSRHLGEPHNVVIEEGLNNDKELKRWAQSVESTRAQLWLQLNHPGKQSPKFLNKEPLAPSAIAFSSSLKSAFNKPRELSPQEITEVIERFCYAARKAKECGFGGVQIHGAHGYLVSQFLSPRHNKRTDKYGGAIENRMRFLVELYESMRMAVGPDYPIGLKLNSADFSKGGFSNDDALEVAQQMSARGIDLLEISGGSYEAPVMTGKTKESTKTREAYFLDYTTKIRQVIQCPLMVTGGFRTKKFMDEVLERGELDLIGLARPLALDPNLANKLMTGEQEVSEIDNLTSGIKALDKLVPLDIIWYTYQIHRMGQNKAPKPKASVYPAILKTLKDIGIQGLKRAR